MPHDEQTSREFTMNWVTAQPIIASYLFGLVRDRHDAEDLLQEVAGEAFGNYARFDRDRSFVAWVMAIARHRTMDYFRRSKPRCALFDEGTLSALAAAHERLAPEEGDRRLALDHCLRTLGSRSRTAVDLRYEQAISVTEIAARMKTTADTVSTILYKARKALAECIGRRLRSQEAER